MKKLFLIVAAAISMAAARPSDCFASYYNRSTPGQKIGAFGLALGVVASLVAIAEKPFDAAGIGSLALSTLFIAPLADDFLDTSRPESKRVNYDRLKPRLVCALCSIGFGVLGCEIIKEARAGTFDNLFSPAFKAI